MEPKFELINDGEETGIILHNWKVLVSKRNILNSHEIGRWSEELKMRVLPEMIFGHNFLRLDHQSGFSISFNAFDALAQVDNTAELPKVSYADHWLQSKRECVASSDLETVPHTYDWTFTTAYRGSLPPSCQPQPTSEPLDLQLLKQPDPILFFQELVLFEDELGDNGCAVQSVKVRVMPSCLLVLMRFWLRIDDVLFRTYETRLFHRFGQDYCLREFVLKQAPFQFVVESLGGPDPSQLVDPNLSSGLLPTTSTGMERIALLPNPPDHLPDPL